ncbi:MAG: peptidoglycan DD-metalloendopeptidase family protein [Clostridia bacterium]|nr:peptidoglycan DD-metalloendopeptidase family protein [Clostridia bacterium]
MKSKKILSVILVISLVFSSLFTLTASADKLSEEEKNNIQTQINELEQKSKELEKEIANLKSQKADQQAIVNAVQKKINNTESQILACNKEISRINTAIAENNAEIKAKNEEIANDKLLFKKRLRASYMSSTDNSLQLLLGADNFADYLQLSQLMKAVSAHDRALLKKLAAAIEVLNKKNEENQVLIDSQVSVKETIALKQNTLLAERAEEQKYLNSITADTNSVIAENKAIEASKRQLEQYFLSMTESSDVVLSAEYFIWPVPGYYGVTQHYGNAGHTGIDLASSGIAGKPVVAIADGQIETTVSNWSPSMGYYGNASYGNYVVINHGSRNGYNYMAWYAHLMSVTVSPGQTVRQGQTIGYVGTTGRSTGYHLHLELKRKAVGSKYYTRLNPYPYIKQQVKP